MCQASKAGQSRRLPIHLFLLIGGCSAAPLLTDENVLLQAHLSVQPRLLVEASIRNRGAGVEAAWEVLHANDSLHDSLHEVVQYNHDREEGDRPKRRRHEGMESQMPLELNDWPGLGHIWGEVREGASNLTGQVGDVMRDPARQVPDLAHDLEEEVSLIAEALSASLRGLQKELVTVLRGTSQDKLRLVQQIGGLQLPELMPTFEFAMTEYLGSALGRWGILTDAVDRTTLSISSGLEVAGQVQLARTLKLEMQIAETKVDSFVRDISNAKTQIRGISSSPTAQLNHKMYAANSKLNEALKYEGQFVLLFQQAFMDMMDSISNAAIWSKVDVSQFFGPVQKDVQAVAWQSRAASRELILGARAVLGTVANRVDITLPAWEPVSMPLLENGSAHPWRGRLLALTLVLAGLVGL